MTAGFVGIFLILFPHTWSIGNADPGLRLRVDRATKCDRIAEGRSWEMIFKRVSMTAGFVGIFLILFPTLG